MKATELRWMASLPASALAAAEAILEGQTFADPNLQAALDGPARKLIATIRRFGVQSQPLSTTASQRGKPAPTSNVRPEKVLPHLIALSAGIPGPLQLADVALTKVTDRAIARDNASRLAELIRQMITAFQTAVPNVADQLAVRGEPLQQQWEARGPGLMGQLSRLTDAELIPTQADVILIYPLLGGDGRPYLPYNTVRLEAVLADPIPNLPEVLRLAWLLAQLNCDVAKFQGDMTRDELAETAALAMIPAVLSAAEEVELAGCDAATIALAINAWRVTGKEAEPELASTLQVWWETNLNTRPAWHVAMAALNKMRTDR